MWTDQEGKEGSRNSQCKTPRPFSCPTLCADPDASRILLSRGMGQKVLKRLIFEDSNHHGSPIAHGSSKGRFSCGERWEAVSKRQQIPPPFDLDPA